MTMAPRIDEVITRAQRAIGEREGAAPARNGTAKPPVTAGTKALAASPFRWSDPASLPPRRWLYGQHLIRQFCSTTLAAGGLGKTSLIIAEALAQATKRPLLGEKVHERCRVWLWNGEDPIEELRRRVLATCLHYDISPDAIAGHLFLDSGRDQPIVVVKSSRDGLEIAEPVVEQAIATIRRNSIDVMKVDPL